MQEIVTHYQVLRTEKNLLWYPKLVGAMLNQIQYDNVLFKDWIDVKEVKYVVTKLYHE